MDLNHDIEQYLNDATGSGWLDRYIPFPEAISLLHSEVSEALNEFRNHKEYDEIYYTCEVCHSECVNCSLNFTVCPNRKPQGIGIEFADIFILLLSYSGYYGIDLSSAIDIKCAFNRLRPYRHGGKKI